MGSANLQGNASYSLQETSMTTSVVDNVPATVPVTHHRTMKIDGINIFYREAGPAPAPGVLLFHGFPTSSAMFRTLVPALAGPSRVISPDFPGYRQSARAERPKI